MNEKINITKMDGSLIQADILCLIENLQTKRQFIYYTLNEIMGTEPNSTVKLYVSKINQGNPALDTPITDAEWTELRSVMSDVLKGNTNANIKYVPLSSNSVASISDKVIAMPTSYDYISKQKGAYAQSVASQTAVVSSPIQTQNTVPVADLNAATPVTVEPTIVSAPEQIVPTQTEIQTPTVAEQPIIQESIISTNPANSVESPIANMQPAAEGNLFDAPSIPTAPIINEQAINNVEIAPIVQEPPISEINPVISKENSSVNLENTHITSEKPLPKMENIEPVTQNSFQNKNLTEIKNGEIDIDEIEEKYNKMIADINSLKEREIEAAKRYNATLELSQLHNEQHANYVAQEQMGSVVNEKQPETLANNVQSIIEPVPVSPIVPQTTDNSVASGIETNWFDMPVA